MIVTSEYLSLSGTGINNTGALLNENGSNSWDGPISLDVNPGFSPATLPSGTVTINVINAGDNLTLFGGDISDSSDPNSVPSGLGKVGLGTLTVNQADSYQGTTYIQSGIVKIQNAQALGTPNSQATQRITVTSTSANGTFTITFKGQTTPALTFGASQGAVATAINNLSSVKPNTVSVVRNTISFTPPGASSPITYYVYTVTFNGAFGLQQQPLMIATGVNGTGASAAASPVAEGALGTLVFNGAALQIDGDPNGVGNSLTVANQSIGLFGTGFNGGGAMENVSGNNTWTGTVTFLTTGTFPVLSNTALGADGTTSLTLSGNVEDSPILATTASTLTKVGTGTVVFPNANTYGGNTVITNGDLDIKNSNSLGINRPEIQTVTTFGTNGSFTLSYKGAVTNPPIPYNVTAAQLTTALDNLSTIGPNGVTVTNVANVFTVKFTGATLIGQALPQILPGNFFNGASASTVIIANGTGSVTVNSGGTLQMDGSGGNFAVTNKALFLNGQGYTPASGIPQGALDNVNGVDSWSFNAGTPNVITLQSPTFIGADGTGPLSINQQIIDNNNGYGVTKVGVGALLLNGGAGFDNLYSGLTQVDEGTLELDMGGGATPFRGNLTIGNSPVIGAASVEWLANNQIVNETAKVATPPTVTIDSNGTLNLNSFSDTIPTLDFVDGAATTGNNGQLTVDALNMQGGAFTLATAASKLILAGNVTATSDTAEEATITGIGTLSQGGVNRTFNVTAGGSQPSDLVMQSGVQIQNTAGENITKTGNGTFEIDGNQTPTFTGQMIVQSGDVQVDGQLTEVNLSGGTVSGIGTVGSIDNGSAGSAPQGTINPGDNGASSPIGTLSTGSTNWGPGTTFAVDLSDATLAPGVGGDLLDVNGNIILNGAQLNGTVGPNVNIGDSFVIIQTTGGGQVIGKFAEPFSPGVTFIGGQKFTVAYTNSSNNPALPVTEVVVTRAKENASIAVVSNINPSVYGQDFFFTATLTPEPGAGNVPNGDTITFTLNTPNGPITQTVPINNNQATFDPQRFAGVTLDPGSYALTATFNGDNSFNSSQTTFNPPTGQIINKSLTLINLSSAPNNPIFGQAVQVFVQITAKAPGVGTPTGTVTFTIDGSATQPITLDATSSATLQLPANLTTGTHRIRVSYSGDLDFASNATTSDFDVIVSKDTDSITPSASPASSFFGQPVTFTAIVASTGPDTDTPTGTISFYDGSSTNGTLLGQVMLGSGSNPPGQASLTVSSLSVASHTITMVYSGDTEYQNGSTTVTNYVVSKDTTTTSLTSSLAPSTFGQSVTFTATVTNISPFPSSPSPVGTITFSIDGVAQSPNVTLNASGVATLTLNTLKIGSHTVLATYNPTTPPGDFATSSASLAQVVRSATTTTLNSSENPSTSGDNVIFTATIKAVSPGTGTPTDGVVQFMIDSVNFGSPASVSGGSATINLSGLSIGTHTVSAQYLGDATAYSPSTSTNLSEVVRSGTITTVTSAADPSVYGTSVTFTAIVGPKTVANGDTAPQGGTITWIIDGQAQAPVLLPASDKVTFTDTSLSLGAHTVEADYSGTTTGWSPSKGTLNQLVDYNSNTTLTSSANPASLGSTVTFTATVKPIAPDSSTPSGTVTFKLNGTQQTVSLSGGVATFSTSNLNFGANTVTAQYNGDGTHVPSTVSLTETVVYPSMLTLSSSANPAVYGQPVTITATVAPVSQSAGTPTGRVTFAINGVPQSPAVTLNSSGVATFTLPVEPEATSAYAITATYSGDSSYATSTQSQPVNQQIILDHTTSTLTSSAISAGDGQAVTFIDNVAPNSPGTIPPGPNDGSVTFFIDGQPVITEPLTSRR